MTIKISGDSSEDLEEIFNAFGIGILTQERFTFGAGFSGYLGFTENGTEGWIGNDGEYVRMVLSSTRGPIGDLFDSNQLLDY